MMAYGIMSLNPKTDMPLAFYIHDDDNQIQQAWEHPLRDFSVQVMMRKITPLHEEELTRIAQLLIIHAGFVEIDIMRVDTFGFVSDEWLNAPVQEPKRVRHRPTPEE